jgi:hypothetical protein
MISELRCREASFSLFRMLARNRDNPDSSNLRSRVADHFEDFSQDERMRCRTFEISHGSAEPLAVATGSALGSFQNKLERIEPEFFFRSRRATS